jgi:hypothetical protein
MMAVPTGSEWCSYTAAPQSHLFGGLAVQEEQVLFAEVVQEQIRLVRP